MEDWLVVRVRSRQYVRAQVNVTNQGAEFYSPTILARRSRTRRFVPEPLFPGYAFARPAGHQWMFLWGTLGILDVLMDTDTSPARISDDVIAGWRSCEDSDGLICPTRKFERGDRVSVESGAMIGLGGVVDSMSGRDRVLILMQLLGRSTRVEVDARDIRRE